MPIPIGVLAVLGSAPGGGKFFAKALFHSSTTLENGALGVSADNNIYFLNRFISGSQFLVLNKINSSGVLEWQTRLATITSQGNENQTFETDSSNNPVVHAFTNGNTNLLQQVAANGASSSFATGVTGSGLTPVVRISTRASSGYAGYGSVSSAGGDCLLGYWDSVGVIQWWRRMAFTGNTNDNFNYGFFNTSSSLIEAYGSVQDGGFVPRPFLARVNTSNSVNDFYRYTNTSQGDNFSIATASLTGSEVYLSITGSGSGSVLMKLDSSRNVAWVRQESSLGGNYSSAEALGTPDGGVINVIRNGSGNTFILQYTKLDSSGNIVYSRRITTTNNMSFYGGSSLLDSSGALVLTATYNNASTSRVETVLLRIPADGTITTSSFSLNGFTWTWATHTASYSNTTSNWGRAVPSLAANTSFAVSNGSLSTSLTTATSTQEATTIF